MRRGEPAPSPEQQQGFTYMWALMAVALVGIGLAAVGTMWSETVRREREAEALRIGATYATAIANYHRSSPGSVKKYPPDLEALLIDTRFLGTRRHLRTLYPDPLLPGQRWKVIRAPDGGVRGVFSASIEPPLRTGSVDLGVTTLPSARRYADWQFIPKIERQ